MPSRRQFWARAAPWYRWRVRIALGRHRKRESPLAITFRLLAERQAFSDLARRYMWHGQDISAYSFVKRGRPSSLKFVCYTFRRIPHIPGNCA